MSDIQHLLTGSRLSAAKAYVGYTVKCLTRHLFIHCYFLQVLSAFHLSRFTSDQKCSVVKKCNTMNHNYQSLIETCITFQTTFVISFTYLSPSHKTCKFNPTLFVLYAQRSYGKKLKGKTCYSQFVLKSLTKSYSITTSPCGIYTID